MRHAKGSGGQGPPKWVRSLSAAVALRYSQSAPPPQTRITPRAAAVLVLLTDGAGGVQVLLTERAPNLGNYPGRLAFPGGARDPSDADPAATALREAHEEIGLNPASVHILGLLPTFVDPKGKFVVTPVLAWSACPDFTGPVSSNEVAEVHQVAVRDLSGTNGIGQRLCQARPSGKPALLVSQLGSMTAAIIDVVSALLSSRRPDDSANIRPERPRD